MSKRSLDIAYFLSFCIEQYKEKHRLSGNEAAKILSQHGVLEYLEEHFTKTLPLTTKPNSFMSMT